MAAAERRRVAEHKALVSTLNRWHWDGMLSEGARDRLASAKADPKVVLRLAMSMLSDREYKVLGKKVAQLPKVSAADAWVALANAETDSLARTAAIQERHEDAYIRGRVAKVKEAIDRGVRGKMLGDVIRRTMSAAEVTKAAKYLDPILKATGAHKEAARIEHTYEGARFTPNQPVKASSEPRTKETESLLRWARQQMSEGFAGKELDQLVENRFAKSVVKAASTAFATLRKAHEGLSGHAYVDAAAYASPTGTTGCEKAASKHRANTIPTVLGMDRCGTCTKRSMNLDGNIVCQVYNKPVVKSAAEVIDGSPREYALEMIRLANNHDFERDAELFSVNSYDHSEFRLGEQTEYDDIPISAATETEQLSGFFFGGFEVE
jgi:hypothetical protein